MKKHILNIKIDGVVTIDDNLPIIIPNYVNKIEFNLLDRNRFSNSKLTLHISNVSTNTIHRLPIKNGKVIVDVGQLEDKSTTFNIVSEGEINEVYELDKEILEVSKIINIPNSEKFSNTLSILVNDIIELQKKVARLEKQNLEDEII